MVFKSVNGKNQSTLTFPILFLIAAFCLAPRGILAEETHAEESDLFGFDLTRGWLDRPKHSHLSLRGTPLIHPFRSEPAFTLTDFLLDYSYRNETGVNEHEIENEMELALTRRVGLIVEIPYRCIAKDHDASVNGFGDLAISPRILLAEYARFLLASSLEIVTPTGDSGRDLGHGEVSLAPSLSGWFDLGNWWTMHTQCGSEHALESDESELFFRAALIHTLGSKDYGDDNNHDVDHDEFHGLASRILSLIFEVDGTIGLSGEEDGDLGMEGIFGAYYSLTKHVDLRVGYQFPLTTSDDLNSGVIGGLIWHF